MNDFLVIKKHLGSRLLLHGFLHVLNELTDSITSDNKIITNGLVVLSLYVLVGWLSGCQIQPLFCITDLTKIYFN